jgi:hypothetical protein
VPEIFFVVKFSVPLIIYYLSGKDFVHLYFDAILFWLPGQEKLPAPAIWRLAMPVNSLVFRG